MNTHTSFTLTANGKVHLAARFDRADQIEEAFRSHFPAGAIVTACRLSFPIGDGETSIPGNEVTCGNCKRARK